jgi:hypothetical protein
MQYQLTKLLPATSSADALGNITGMLSRTSKLWQMQSIKPLALINNADSGGFNKYMASSIIKPYK